MNDQEPPEDSFVIDVDIFEKKEMKVKKKKNGEDLASHLWANQWMLKGAGKILQGLSMAAQYSDWNEKTVEYYFARYILPPDGFAKPLVGDEESMFGDLITGLLDGTGEGLCAIEFKARFTNIDSEYDKFLRTMTRYSDGARPVGTDGKTMPFQKWFGAENEQVVQLEGSRSHFLVYGAKSENAFGLYVEPYALQQKARPLKNFKRLKFCDKLVLTEYLVALAGARFEGPPPGDGGPSMVAEGRAWVAAKLETTLISETGRVMTVEDMLAVFRAWSSVPEDERTALMRNSVESFYRAKHAKPPTKKQLSELQALVERAFLVSVALERINAQSSTALKAIGAKASSKKLPAVPKRHTGAKGKEAELGTDNS